MRNHSRLFNFNGRCLSSIVPTWLTFVYIWLVFFYLLTYLILDDPQCSLRYPGMVFWTLQAGGVATSIFRFSEPSLKRLKRLSYNYTIGQPIPFWDRFFWLFSFLSLLCILKKQSLLFAQSVVITCLSELDPQRCEIE